MHLRQWIWMCVGCAVLLGAALPFAHAQNIKTEPFEISLSSMILFALNDNPDIAMARTREDQAFYTSEEAQAGLYPQVNLAANGGYQYNNPASGKTEPKKSNFNWTSDYSVTLRQIIFDGFQTAEDVKRLRTLEGSAALETEVTVEETITDTVQYYLDVMRYQASAAATSDFVNRMNKIVGDINLMTQEGAASQAKLDYANSRLSSAKNQYTSVLTSLNDARSNLEFLTGKLPDFIAVAPEDLIIEENELYDYLAYASAHNSEIELNKSNLGALEHQLRAEKGAFYPSVNFNLDASKSHNDGGEVAPSREMNAMVQMRYKLFDRQARRAAVSKVKSQMSELDFNEQKIMKELKREIKLLYNQITSVQQLLIDIEDEIAAGEKLKILNQENFEFGEIDAIELIEGEERLIQAKNRKYELLTDLYGSSYRLLILAGLMDKEHFCANC